jgi:4-oxalomesaconate tautomerase
MPVVMMKASDFGMTGYEKKADLDANMNLKNELESLRIEAGKLMNLGDVSNQSIPKMCLISPATQGGLVNTRMFIPHVCHDAIGVLAAVSVATACLIPDTVFDFQAIPSAQQQFSIEHPTGEMTVSLDYFFENKELKIKKSGLLRTARLISRGETFI